MDYVQTTAAVIVGILSVARTARLIAWDEFPPMMWTRVRIAALLGDKWGKLVECQFCLTPYLATGMAAWAWMSETNTWWWVINGVWGLSYVSAMLVSYDSGD